MMMMTMAMAMKKIVEWDVVVLSLMLMAILMYYVCAQALNLSCTSCFMSALQAIWIAPTLTDGRRCTSWRMPAKKNPEEGVSHGCAVVLRRRNS